MSTIKKQWDELLAYSTALATSLIIIGSVTFLFFMFGVFVLAAKLMAYVK